MRTLTEFIARLRAIRNAVFNRSAAERDLDDEIRLHIELETEKNQLAGYTPGEARRRALGRLAESTRQRKPIVTDEAYAGSRSLWQTPVSHCG